MIKRLSTSPVVVLLGSRQVGKTTLARALELGKPCHYLDLERPSDLAKLTDPELYLGKFSNSLVILDEIQRVPDLFPVLRSLGGRAPSRWREVRSVPPARVGLLEGLYLMHTLPAWSKNAGKRLVKAPKTYWRDTGLLHSLAGLTDLENLLGHPLCGHSWEGYCIEQILTRLPAGTIESIEKNWEMWPNKDMEITWKVVKSPTVDGNTDDGKVLMTDGGKKWGTHDLVTKKKYQDFEGHVEFVMMGKRGDVKAEGYANSGVYRIFHER